MNTPVHVRNAEAAEIGWLARLWREGWVDAHQEIVPAELARARTVESFRERLERLIANVRVVGPSGAPVGFHVVKEDELYQLYVAAEARGSGVAASLVADAETQIANAGFETAWLACAIGNDRAARFYEKCGWRRAGKMINVLEIPTGEFRLEVWRYEKSVAH